mgnify:FL=1
MMDKKPHIKPYLYGMLAGFGAISLSILFFFFIYRFDGFGDAVSKVCLLYTSPSPRDS